MLLILAWGKPSVLLAGIAGAEFGSNTYLMGPHRCEGWTG